MMKEEIKVVLEFIFMTQMGIQLKFTLLKNPTSHEWSGSTKTRLEITKLKSCLVFQVSFDRLLFL